MKRDPDPYYRQSIVGKTGTCEMAWPNVSVFDPDGHLPLVLQRNALATQKYPFQEQLFQDVIRDLLAYLLARAPQHPLDGRGPYGEWYPGVTYLSRRSTPSFHLCSAADGLYPADEWHIKRGGFHRFLFVGGLASSGKGPAQIPPSAGSGRTLLIPVPDPGGSQRHRDWNRFALCGVRYDAFGYLDNFSASCRRMLLLKSEYDAIKKGNVISKYWWSDVKEESSNEEWVVVRNGDCDCGEPFDLLEFTKSIESHTPWPILIEWHLGASQSEPKAITPLAALWRDLLRPPAIPYDSAARREKLPEAFDQLGDYIAAHEQLLVEEKKARKEKKPPGLLGDDESAD
jgi:hypothetical protein